jgi:hypothetical protein
LLWIVGTISPRCRPFRRNPSRPRNLTISLTVSGTVFRKQRFVTGRRTMVAWRCPQPSGYGHWIRRTPSSTAASGHETRRRRLERPSIKKMATPAAMRETVVHLQARLGMSERQACRRTVCVRAAPPVMAQPNQRWSLESPPCGRCLRLVHEQIASGRRFRVLNIVDDVTRECLAVVLETSISGRLVVSELTELIRQRGKPGMIVSDKGTELTCKAVLPWCSEGRDRLALYRTRQADAERLREVVQRPDARPSGQWSRLQSDRESVLPPQSHAQKDRRANRQRPLGAYRQGRRYVLATRLCHRLQLMPI